jgi:hypothetical protein
MLNLLVDGYVNNKILGYENNLRIILTDEGVNVSNEDNMDSLITKVDEEFDRKSANSGLDIISATELPATGKENQICIITNNPNQPIVISNSPTSTNTNAILCELGAKIQYGALLEIVNKNNIITNLYFTNIQQNNKNLFSYIYKDNQWNKFLCTLNLLSDGKSNSNYTWRNATTLTTHINYTEGTGLTLSEGEASARYMYITTGQKIDFSQYSKVAFTVQHASSSTTTDTFYIYGVDVNSAGNYSSSFPSYVFRTEPITVSKSTSKTNYTVDLPVGANGQYYFGICRYANDPKCYVTDITLL